MSKKQLLTESEVRRFMRLANIPALGKNLVNEVNQIPQDDRRPETDKQEEAMDPMAGGMEGGAEAAPALPAGDDMAGLEGGETVEVGGDVDPEKQEAFEAAVQALADAMGIDVELEGQEEHGEEAGEEMHDLDSGDEEGGEEEGEEEGGEEEEGDEEEMQEAKKEEEPEPEKVEEAVEDEKSEVYEKKEEVED